jgi:hypothetical protein
MRYGLFLLIILEVAVLGFYVGKTAQVHDTLERQQLCKSKIFQQKLDLAKFFDMDMKKLSIKSHFIHAQTAAALRFQLCMTAD